MERYVWKQIFFLPFMPFVIFKVLISETGHGYRALQREDFHMYCSKLCSTFVLIGTSLGTQFKLCRSLANISFRSYMLQLLRWVQFWAQVRKAGVESCTQVWEVLAGECCKTEWEELRATQVSFQVLNNRIL